MTDDVQGIDEQSPEVAEMAQAWPVVDALVGGTAAMRAAGKKFLPKFPAEDEEFYMDRLNASVLFPHSRERPKSWRPSRSPDRSRSRT